MVILCFQIGALLIALCLAFSVKPRRRGLFSSLARCFNRLARHRRLAVAASGAAGVATAAAMSGLGGVPLPNIHDEFSFLLGADTFAEGRIANPSHPLWVHFESFHIIVQPVYATKYPPAQSLVLAFGQVVGGHPIVGVWLGMGLATAAACWMLQAFVPARWALLGAMFVATQNTIVREWGYSYMGGQLAMAGGAIVYGAWRRLWRQPQAGASILFAFGLIVLANTRPFEGAIISLPAAVSLGWRLAGPKRWPTNIAMKCVVLPAVCVLAPASAAMGLYNARITGDALRFPYLMHDETYMTSPPLAIMKQRNVSAYNHRELRDFFNGWPLEAYRGCQTTMGWLEHVGRLCLQTWSFYVLPAFTIPLLMIPWIWRDRPMRIVLVAIGLELVALAFVVWRMPHYAAPATGLITLVIIQGMRRLRACRRCGYSAGRSLVSAIVVIQILSFSLMLVLHYAKQRKMDNRFWFVARERMLDDLNRQPGRHLVIVRYREKHILDDEWVYNRADIDHAKVVWAREMDPEQNRKLLEYFRDRRVWLLVVDDAIYPLAEIQIP